MGRKTILGNVNIGGGDTIISSITTVVDSNSTDTQLPTAKAVFNATQGGGGSSSWGSITGTLTNQIDLYNVLKSLARTDGLCFTAEQENSTVAYEIIGSISDYAIQTSTDGVIWTAWDGSPITLTNIGDKVYVRNTKNQLSVNISNYFKFVMTGKISASGNCNSMINYQEVSDYCFAKMFSNCASLTKAPVLPSSILKGGCYAYMFEYCTSLIEAPDILASIFIDAACAFMFSYCSSLIQPFYVYSHLLAPHCFRGLYYNAINLKVNNDGVSGTLFFTAPATLPVEATYEMLTGTGGTYTSDPVENGEYYYGGEQALCLTAVTANATVAYTASSSLTGFNIQISTDEGSTWNDWDGTAITLANVGDKVYVKNTTNTLSTSTSSYFKFVMTGKLNASGNIMSLLNYGSLNNYCFYSLFSSCTSLITPPSLPATELATGCYYALFNGCSKLLYPPLLPATTLQPSCYRAMFSYCSIIKVKTTATNATKFFTCPATIPTQAVTNMFTGTGGTTTTDPTANQTYYYYV